MSAIARCLGYILLACFLAMLVSIPASSTEYGRLMVRAMPEGATQVRVASKDWLVARYGAETAEYVERWQMANARWLLRLAKSRNYEISYDTTLIKWHVRQGKRPVGTPVASLDWARDFHYSGAYTLGTAVGTVAEFVLYAGALGDNSQLVTGESSATVTLRGKISGADAQKVMPFLGVGQWDLAGGSLMEYLPYDFEPRPDSRVEYTLIFDETTNLLVSEVFELFYHATGPSDRHYEMTYNYAGDADADYPASVQVLISTPSASLTLQDQVVLTSELIDGVWVITDGVFSFPSGWNEAGERVFFHRHDFKVTQTSDSPWFWY